LLIEAVLMVDGESLIRSLSIDLTHRETDNTPPGSICANGESQGAGLNDPGCADLVSIVAVSPSRPFLVAGDWLRLSVSGFVTPSGIVRQLETSEEMNTQTALAASIIAVPAPPAVMLLTLGVLAGFIGRPRRLRKRFVLPKA